MKLCQNRVFEPDRYREEKITQRARSPPPFLEIKKFRKGGEELRPENHEENVRHEFESFCKSVSKRTACNCYKLIKRRNEREITFSSMPVRELDKLTTADTYFVGKHSFNVLGEDISLSDCELSEALNALPPDKRDIILMSYFFEMTDKEIAEHLNMARRTVTYQRSKSLQELKRHMEGE